MDTSKWLEEFNKQTAPQDILSDIADCFCGPGMRRFLYYSGRVKYLRVSSADGFPPILFELLQRSNNPVFFQPDNPILLTPSHRGLVWQHSSLTMFPYIDLFAGPLLQKLYTGIYPQWRQGGRKLLQHTVTYIQRSCPRLEELGIGSESQDVAVGGGPEDVDMNDELEGDNEAEDINPAQAPIASV